MPYLRKKNPDVIFYSEDGTEFKTHKELLGQTRFMRELIKSTNCCDTIVIICPCSKRELGQLIDFVIHGKIQCIDEKELSKILENLQKIFGFIVLEDILFVIPNMSIKNEFDEQEFQNGLSLLEAMDDSIFKNVSRNEDLKTKGKKDSDSPNSDIKEEMYDAVLDSSKNPEGTPELFHGYTYSGIPAAVAAGLAVQDIFEKECT